MIACSALALAASLALAATLGLTLGWWLAGRRARRYWTTRLVHTLAGIDRLNRASAAATARARARLRALHSGDGTPFGGA